MSNKDHNIPITKQDLTNDPELIDLFGVPWDIINHRHPSVTPEIKKRILKEKYKKRVIADGIESGQLTLNEHGYVFRSKLNSSQFAGLVFEAFLVDRFNSNRSEGLRAFTWCTEDNSTAATKHFEEFLAVGTGLISTQREHIGFYEPHSNADIIFLRKNHSRNEMENALVKGTNLQSAIQVKCIKYNIIEEVVKTVISGKYRNVITMLSDTRGIPSWVTCHSALATMKRRGTITTEQYAKAIAAIHGPEYFGLAQHDIDDYHEYILEFWKGNTEEQTKNINDAIDQEINAYTRRNGLLVPLSLK
ncbi:MULTISPECIES: hypothetical protein [Enterobacter]|jgi:hypothetical protein|uniref:hypothetical protein n=2 Tax=Enterobacteriaceae TaxID=543 RepID=UPI0007930F08|nr:MULTISPECIES: hypothetical protein [Enterobacter]MBE4994490.1 hypothetical protein [Enterobacter cloacae complex sp. P6RS]MCK7236095.1 hypothetical protein [Enterobacter bugandensis]SAI60810.1 Uncharacterised protein [Enterobacter bugandensis]HDR2492198.1 hypothetical protein [Enterobacter bugandensis]